MSASNICTSTTSRSGASSRSGWRARTPRSSFTPEGKQAILAKVIQAEQWEKFLARKYVGTKRFGLDGGESDGPGARSGDQIWRPATASSEIVIGMAHRGRLNVLANVMAKPYRAIFHEFAGGSANPGMSAARATSNITSAPRPTASSTGSRSTCRWSPTRPTSKRSTRSCSARRARCRRIRATTQGDTGAAVLLHGDAAFAGQGIVVGMPRLLRPPRLRHRRHASISSSTTRSASPPARNSRARRLIRRTSPRASRRRSSTSMATIPKR